MGTRFVSDFLTFLSCTFTCFVTYIFVVSRVIMVDLVSKSKRDCVILEIHKTCTKCVFEEFFRNCLARLPHGHIYGLTQRTTCTNLYSARVTKEIYFQVSCVIFLVYGHHPSERKSESYIRTYSSCSIVYATKIDVIKKS